MRKQQPTVEAVIFDLDGVIRYWSPTIISQSEARAGLPAGALADAVLGNPTLLQQVITGRITDAEWREAIAAQLSASHGVGGPRAVREWSAAVGEVVPDVADLVRRTRGWATVALLTNATTRLHEDLARLDLMNDFDAIFNSSELGVAKPDPTGLLEACRRLGVDPHRCAFVDDSADNVAAATTAGLIAHHYRSSQRLSSFLKGLEPTGPGGLTAHDRPR